MMSVTTMTVTISVLVGFNLAPNKAYATLPFTAQLIASTLMSIPAAMLMARIGRKPAFMLATLLGMSAGVLCTYAIMQSSFFLFVMGCILIGLFNGFGYYYRFAAADAVDADYKSRAIAYVLAGGVVAAFIGPNIATYTKDLIGNVLFAGSFATLVGFYLLILMLLNFLKLPMAANRQDGVHVSGRPLASIMKQPCFIVAVLNGMLGYSVMSLIMTATPLAMQHNHHALPDTSFVIQWHVLGMFAPSFFTGTLIRRIGLLKIMFTGGMAGLACVVINLTGTSVSHFWLALFLLGISWNFLFIGATTMLTETYQPEERFKTQAANDFIVFSMVATASLSAGALQHHFGWQAVNYGAIPALIIILCSLLWLRFVYTGLNDFPDSEIIQSATSQTET